MKRPDGNFKDKYKNPTSQWMALTPAEQDEMIARAEEIMHVSEELSRLVDKNGHDASAIVMGMLEYSRKRTAQLMESVGVDPKDMK